MTVNATSELSNTEPVLVGGVNAAAVAVPIVLVLVLVVIATVHVLVGVVLLIWKRGLLCISLLYIVYIVAPYCS